MTAVDDVRLWYHTLDLPGHGVTPGWFDLRAQVNQLPWPDVSGKRCLDVGTYDGFYAFELERRGALEVLATDIGDQHDWDLPRSRRAMAGEEISDFLGEKGVGFEVARRALGSRVQKRTINVYDLSPEEVGTFDVVVCGSLMLHLRDPIRALEAIRSVCTGWFLSIEQISLGLTVCFRRRPVADVQMSAQPTQWWIPNAAGHRRMLEVAGFEVNRSHGPFAIPFGVGHSPRGRDLRSQAVKLSRRLLAGSDGVPHSAALGRAVDAS